MGHLATFATLRLVSRISSFSSVASRVSRVRHFHKSFPIYEKLKLPAPDKPKPKGKGGTLIESLLGPPGEHPHELGNLTVCASALVGLGSLCYYGLKIGKADPETSRSVISSVHLWSEDVRDRVRSTYGFFGASVFWTAGASAVAFRSRAFMKLMFMNSWVILGCSLTAQVLSGIAVWHMDYQPGFSLKHLMWIVHSCILGISIAPMCYIGGAVLVRAFMMTSGVILGLSAIACCAPEGHFLNWSAPLAAGLGFTFMSALGAFIFPQTTKLGMGLFTFYLYGGLIFFFLLLLHDTQKMIRHAERVPHNDLFDPINAAISLYMDALNIFVRWVQHAAIQELAKIRRMK